MKERLMKSSKENEKNDRFLKKKSAFMFLRKLGKKLRITKTTTTIAEEDEDEILLA